MRLSSGPHHALRNCRRGGGFVYLSAMGLLTPVAIKIGSFSWMPKLLPQIVWIDKRLHQVTRGRYCFVDIAGLPSIVLTVPGRKSGILRSTNLLTVPDGDEWLIAGSFFGDPRPPVWVANLRATETVTIRYRRQDHTVTLARAGGEERDQAWETMNATVAQLRQVRRADRPGDPGLPAHRRLTWPAIDRGPFGERYLTLVWLALY